ncbi:hypothetical protein [Actinoplanes sp. NPDC089786]|uniref:hypothetical protein n=1 Tax=Actinoplanes sp. NPDC089786 TaxID=3155185 RepID=UPI003436CDD1
MVERVQLSTGNLQRAMVGVAAGYVLFAGLVSFVDESDAWGFLVVFTLFAAAIANPLVFREPAAFTIACVVTAVLVLILGFFLAAAGLYLLWPSALPLLLAPTPLPRLAPPWPHLAVGLLTAAAVLTFYAAAA